MMKVWRIDWGHCFCFRSFIRVCGYRVVWLALKSIIKLLFIAAVKEEVPLRRNRCQMDSLGGWRIIFINWINTAWASAMRIPLDLWQIRVSHAGVNTVTRGAVGKVLSLLRGCSPWRHCMGHLRPGARCPQSPAPWRVALSARKPCSRPTPPTAAQLGCLT